MSTPIHGRLSAGVVAVTPLALAIALVSHPHIAGRLPNDAAVADAVLSDPERWAAVHLVTGVASGLVAVAFILIARYLEDAGEDRWSRFGLPWVVLGSVLYAFLPGLEFAPWAAAATGGNVVAAQAAIGVWFLPVFLVAGALFAVGGVAFAGAVWQSGVLGRTATLVVAAALVVLALSRLVPYMAVQMYVQSAAAVVVFWPLAGAMWGGRLPATLEQTPTRAARKAEAGALAPEES